MLQAHGPMCWDTEVNKKAKPLVSGTWTYGDKGQERCVLRAQHSANRDLYRHDCEVRLFASLSLLWLLRPIMNKSQDLPWVGLTPKFVLRACFPCASQTLLGT